MAKPEDVQDPALRSGLVQADESLNEGNYLEAVRRCMDTYVMLLEKRPDLAPPNPPPGGQAPAFSFGPPTGGGAGGGPGGPGRRALWPTLGVRLVLDEDKKPHVTFDKERFSLSEAATYFEYTMDQVIKAQQS